MLTKVTNLVTKLTNEKSRVKKSVSPVVIEGTKNKNERTSTVTFAGSTTLCDRRIQRRLSADMKWETGRVRRESRPDREETVSGAQRICRIYGRIHQPENTTTILFSSAVTG